MKADGIRSRWVDLPSPVHVAGLGGEGVPVVCVHGLGGSYANWIPSARSLRSVGQVDAIDLPGFGLSPPAPDGAGLDINRRVLDRYLRTLGRPAVLIGNSMGGAIALRQAAVAPETVERLVLVSPAAPWPFRRDLPDPLVAALFLAYMLPGVARLLLYGRRTLLSPEAVARWMLALCAARPERLGPEVVDLHVEVAERRRDIPGIDRAFTEATRSVIWSALRRGPHDRDVAAVQAPTLVIHGGEDRLVSAKAAERLAEMRPDWQVEILPDVGHVAMLEVPATFGRLVTEFLGERIAS